MRRLFYLIVFIITILPAKGQTQDLDSLLDAVIFEDIDFLKILNEDLNFHYIYANSGFENKTFFAGRDIGIDQYNVSGQLSYFNTKGFQAGIAGFMYSEFEPKLTNMVITAGYSGKLSNLEGLKYRGSYSRFIYSKVDSVATNAFSGSVNMGVFYQNTVWGARTDLSLLHGEDYSFQLSGEIYGLIPLAKWGRMNRLRIEPSVMLFLGKEDVIYSKTGGDSGTWQYIIVDDPVFGLMTTDLHLPVNT